MLSLSFGVNSLGLISDAVVHLFPKGWHGNEGYRGIDDSSTTPQMNKYPCKENIPVLFPSPFLFQFFRLLVATNEDDSGDPNSNT